MLQWFFLDILLYERNDIALLEFVVEEDSPLHRPFGVVFHVSPTVCPYNVHCLGVNISARNVVVIQYPLTLHLPLYLQLCKDSVHLHCTHSVVLCYLRHRHRALALKDLVVIAHLRKHLGYLVPQFHILTADVSYLLLLLDTNGYTGQRYEASLSEATLAWMQGQLELAREKGWPVIAAGHYPLLTGYSTPFVHKDRAAGLLESYGVQLYLAGHLHKRCVAVQGELAELVVDQAIAYPCCYAMLEVDGESCRYTPRQIAVSDWAAQSGTYDPSLLGFDACQTELEQARCRGIVERLRGDRDVGAEALTQAEDFFWQLMDSRAHGTVSEHADALRAHPGYGLLVELAV